MFLDLFFPKTCLACGKFGSYICNYCKSNMEYISKDSCLRCQKITINGLIHPDCKETEGLDGSLSFFYYNQPAKKIIKNIKYRLVTAACEDFFNSIPSEIIEKTSQFKKLYKNCLLLPIPLHPHRYATRGFNQAEIIAKYFQKIMKYPISQSLIRIKKTVPQAQTRNKIERSMNMKNAFQVVNTQEIQEKNIILVDDVMTTGNTMKQAAKVLKQAGATNVFAFTLAHG